MYSKIVCLSECVNEGVSAEKTPFEFCGVKYTKFNIVANCHILVNGIRLTQQLQSIEH